jgi:predicted nucleic acid-binding protein
LKDEVFLDASYAIALSSPTDEHHDRAGELAERIEAEETRLVTTRAGVLEIGNALAGLRYRVLRTVAPPLSRKARQKVGFDRLPIVRCDGRS